MVQLWMYGKVVSVHVLTNVAGDQWDGTRLSIAFDDFGKQGRAATQKGRKKVKKGTFIDAFLAVSAKGSVYYQTNPDFNNSYKYSHILDGLLDSWDGSNSKQWVFLSHQMEGSSTALKAIQQHRHQALVYPASHADIHLGDVIFFNIRDTVQERHPQAFNDLYLGVLDNNSLFGHQMVADLFAQMVFHGFCSWQQGIEWGEREKEEKIFEGRGGEGGGGGGGGGGGKKKKKEGGGGKNQQGEKKNLKKKKKKFLKNYIIKKKKY
ncbi:hypothetical protein DSO57_1019379 [Entomophthora muscae]|uniref:Uncharacterized protein n=1 Tax=Entomophthora muscae TaxID=34485 RepID=A0ACC2ST93_9FUNG|nr:hypothetical protein DSO57_1019379 [Entomophthora muscae]